MKNKENYNNSKLNIGGVSEADLKRGAFKTPEGYFENLTPRILESVRNSEELGLGAKFDWTKFLVPSFGIATAVMAAWFFFTPTDNSSPDFDTVLASFTVEELTEYANLDASELVRYELVDYNQLAAAEFDLTEEDIIEYISEDELELNSIIDAIEI